MRSARLAPVDEPGASRPSRRGLVTIIGLLLVLGGVAAFRLVGLSHDLQDARALIDRAGVALEQGRTAEARQALQRADTILIEASSTLHTAPDLQLVSLIPVARQNVQALRATVAVSLRLTVGGVALLQDAEALEGPDGRLDVPLVDGGVPLDDLLRAQQHLVEVRAALDPPSSFTDPSPLVVGPIADAQQRVADELEQRRPQVVNLQQALALLGEVLGANGDRRYLLAVANTAEMRGSGGMYLSYGVLESSGGELRLGDFGGIDDLQLSAPVDPTALGVPEDELARWNGLEPTRLWRNVNLVPDFAVVAPRAMAMFQSATGLAVDGVIQMDPAGLGAILAGVGPVSVDQVGEVTAENVVSLTLNEAYTRFPDRDQRQEALGDVAEAAFRRLVEGSYPSLRTLADAVADATAERHILFYSPRTSADGPQRFFATTGALPAPDATDGFVLTTQNRGRDKLDFYLDSSVSIVGARPGRESSTVDVEVTFTNTAPPGVDEPLYVFGGNAGTGVEIGTYQGIASLYVPNGSQLVPSPEVTDAQVLLQPEDGRTAVGWTLTIPAGGSQTLHFQLVLPPRPNDDYVVQLAPIPRVRPTTWSLQLETGGGEAVRRDGPLLEPETISPS